MKEAKLRVGVIGLGKMGLVHAGIMNVLPNVQVIALCEKNTMIQRFAKKVFRKLAIVDDVEKLSDLNLDAVHVTTPIPSHFSISKTVLTKKIAKNIFVEKTLAQNYEESRQLSDLARSVAGVNMVGYLRRFYVTFNKAKDLLNNGTLGKVTSFRAYAYSSDFCEAETGGKTSASRGGVLRDLGCHAVDMASWLFGDLRVSHVTASPDGRYTGDSVNFKVANSELEGEIDVSWRMQDYRFPEVGFSIQASKGELIVNDDHVKLGVMNEKSSFYRQDLDDNVPFLLGLPEYYREDAHFVKSIIESKRAEPDFYAASEVDKIIGQVEKEAGGQD